ncbi:MAG TPA: WGR domain-containing protein [Kofleriaceae bacterium]
MPRYELSEGSSNKFWEINLDGASFTTTYGKLGASGQTTIKKWKDAGQAKLEYEKLIGEKTKKGYALVGGNGKAKAAPAPAKAAKAPTKAANGKRYFELVDGSSSKFWEASVDGTTLKTRHGKIGATGQIVIKEFSAKPEAIAAMDKLVAEKTKKGYVEGGGGEPPADDAEPAKATGGFKRDARNPDLEKAIAADPFDRQAYAVFGDWLQEQGDPRGELIALQLAYKDKAGKALIDEHADYFLGSLVDEQKTRDGLSNNSVSHLRTPAQEKEWQKTGEQAFLWRNGYIYRVRLSHDSYADGAWKGKSADVLDRVLSHPSGRYVVEFSFLSNGDPNEGNLQDIIDVLGKKVPPTTRKITFGDNIDQISWHHTGKLDKLWKGVPNLRVLEIESGEFDVGKMVAPQLERAIFITGGLTASCGKNIATATMPKIKHLEIYYGTEDYGGDCSVKELVPLLQRTDLPKLEYLGLKNSMFANDIARAVVGSKLVKQVKTLDLSMGAMTDDGARALADGKASLQHLECLDLTRNFLTKDGIKLVKSICPKVITADQEEADADGDETYYFVAITE